MPRRYTTLRLLVLLAALVGCTDRASEITGVEVGPDTSKASAGLSALLVADTPARLESQYRPGTCIARQDGGKLVLAPCAAVPNQEFVRTAAGELRMGELCVNATGGDGVMLTTCSGATTQRWSGTEQNEIRNANGKCMDFSLGRQIPIVWSCHGGINQKWTQRLGTSLREATPFLRIPARRASDFVNSVGVNVHLSFFGSVYDKGFETIVKPKLAELGVRNVRDGGRYYPSAASWNRKVYGERYRGLAEATGARFTIIMTPAGDFTAATNWSNVEHVDELVGLVGVENVAAFEGLNEHNISGRPNWVPEVQRLQKGLFARVNADPALRHLPVLGPTFTNSYAGSKVGDLSAHMDFAAIHPYPGGKVPADKGLIDDVARYRPVNGSRDAWITETGYHTAPTSPDLAHTPVSERAMGRYTLRILLHAAAMGVPRTFLYELIDQGTTPDNMQKRFGLLRNDGTEKPAFTGLKHLLGLLEDTGGASFAPKELSFALDGDATDVRWTAFQKQDGRQYLVLWQDVPSYDPATRTDVIVRDRVVTLRLPESARSLRTFVPLVSANPVSSAAGVRQISVAVPDHPVVVEITR